MDAFQLRAGRFQQHVGQEVHLSSGEDFAICPNGAFVRGHSNVGHRSSARSDTETSSLSKSSAARKNEAGGQPGGHPYRANEVLRKGRVRRLNRTARMSTKSFLALDVLPIDADAGKEAASSSQRSAGDEAASSPVRWRLMEALPVPITQFRASAASSTV